MGGKWEEAVGWVQVSIIGVCAYQKEIRPGIVLGEREARVTREEEWE